MVALAVDREQLRSDVKTVGAYLLLFGIVIGQFGAVLEMIGVTNFLPALGDFIVSGLVLALYAYIWKDEIRLLAEKVCLIPGRLYNRYTVEENAGNSGST